MDMTLPQTPTIPQDFVPIQPSLRESPAKLRKEINKLKAKIEEEEEELKMLKNHYKSLEVNPSNPTIADTLLQTLTWINRTSDEITNNTVLLSAANTSLKRVEREAELRNTGMLHLAVSQV